MANERVQAALKVLKEEGVETKIVPEDETTGEVGDVEDEKIAGVEEGLIVERADSGHGFQLYMDYSKSNKYKRLCR